MSKNTREQVKAKQDWQVIMALALGLLIGSYGYNYLANYASKVEILYISQAELIALEKERLGITQQGKGLRQDTQLFNNRAKQVIEQLEQVATSYQSRRQKVVFSNDLVSGSNVRSISQEVYQQLLPVINDK